MALCAAPAVFAACNTAAVNAALKGAPPARQRHVHVLTARCRPPPPRLLPPQVKGTVLLMPNGSDKITSAPAQPVNSAKSCEDEEIKALLAQGLKNKKKKDKKAKAVAA